MEKLKASRYNFFFEEDGTAFAFNALTGGFAKLSVDGVKRLKGLMEKNKIDGNNLPLDLKEDLKRGGFLIPEDFDELEFIKQRDRAGRFSNNILELTILPTTRCNFQCIYCYEASGREVMSKEIADGLVALVKRASKAIKRLRVIWYGGEPLLELGLIVSLTEKFLEICKEEKITYIGRLLTNGYLINEENMEEIKSLRLSAVQVTLDGPPEVHNARRPLKGGGPTFEKIIESIKLLTKANIPVNIRVNVDKQNRDRVSELFDYLFKKENIPRDKVIIYFGRVHSDTLACAGFAPECLDAKEFSDTELKNYKYMIDYDLPIPRIALTRPTSACGATSPHSFTVAPSGNLYKCWLEVDNPARSVGRLRPDGSIRYIMPMLLKWVSWDVFNYPECRECKFLPICMGGCPYRAELLERGECISTKFNLREVFKYYYKYLLKNAATYGRKEVK